MTSGRLHGRIQLGHPGGMAIRLRSSSRVARDVGGRAEHPGRIAGRAHLTERQAGIGAGRAARAGRRACREQAGVIGTAEAGRPGSAGPRAIIDERGADPLLAGDARLFLPPEPRAIVSEGLLRRAPARGIRRITRGLQSLKARLFGHAEAHEVHLTAAVDDVPARETVGCGGARAIEGENRLTGRGPSPGTGHPR
jgi:hypothetical protein